jgi:hypothetical protein
VFTALANSRGFAAFATIVSSVGALLNGVALVLGVLLGHVGFRTIGQAAWLIIFAFLAVRSARRWRRTPPTAPPTGVEQ